MKSTKNRRIVISVPANILKDVDWLAPLEELTRDELIMEAIKRFLKPHLEIRKQVLKAASLRAKTFGPFNTHEELIASLNEGIKKLRDKKKYRSVKAISESTKDFKTGRYEA